MSLCVILRPQGVDCPLGGELTARGLRVSVESPGDEAAGSDAKVFVTYEGRGIATARAWAAHADRSKLARTICYGGSVSLADIAQLDRLGIRYYCDARTATKQLVRLIGAIDAESIMAARGRIEEAKASAAALFSATSSCLELFPSATNFDQGYFKDLGNDFVSRVRETDLPLLLDAIASNQQTTIQHCSLVTTVAVVFAATLGLSQADSTRLFYAAFFHDIGKSVIPSAVIDKPGRLTPAEMELVRTHVSAGYDMLRRFPETEGEVASVALHHHEYLDGSGYPFGLRGNEISDIIRMITISDIFAALIERRSYKPPMKATEAYDILRGMEGKLDQDLVRVFETVADRLSMLAA